MGSHNLQMRELLTQISTIKSDIASLKGHMSDIAKTQQDILSNLHSLRELTSIVASLKIEIRRLREGSHSGSRPSTPRPKGGHAKTNTMYVSFPILFLFQFFLNQGIVGLAFLQFLRVQHCRSVNQHHPFLTQARQKALWGSVIGILRQV